MKSVINGMDAPDIKSASVYDFSLFDEIPKGKARLTLMLIMLQEISCLAYKAECATYEYCIEAFAGSFMAYQTQLKMLRAKIVSDWCGEQDG